MTVGARVKAARESAHLSQKRLAEKIGLSELTVIRLEKGRREAKSGELEKIADALNISVAELMGFESDVSPVPMPTGKLVSVPLLSPEVTVCCGEGIPAYSEIQNAPEEVYRYTISDLGGVFDDLRPPYAVRADGACLEKSRIFDGDILIFNPALEPRQGQICVVCWGGSLSAKKVVRHADGSVTLYSDADEFKISSAEAGDAERFMIWGPVVASRRKF